MAENRTIFFGPDEKIGSRLRAKMTVDLPIDVVFDFFADTVEIHHLFVKPDLEKIFRFRQDKLSEIFAEIIAKQSSGHHPPSSSRLGLPVADQENQTEPAREFNS